MAASPPNEALMKALVYTGPKRVKFQEVPDPVPAPGEAILEVESVGFKGNRKIVKL